MEPVDLELNPKKDRWKDYQQYIETLEQEEISGEKAEEDEEASGQTSAFAAFQLVIIAQLFALEQKTVNTLPLSGKSTVIPINSTYPTYSHYKPLLELFANILRQHHQSEKQRRTEKEKQKIKQQEDDKQDRKVQTKKKQAKKTSLKREADKHIIENMPPIRAY